MTRWQPNAPATEDQIRGINRRLAGEWGHLNLSGTKFEGHTEAPAGLTRLQANQAITALDRLPYLNDNPSICRGGKCDAHSQCSRHGAEYQAKYGRAYNE